MKNISYATYNKRIRYQVNYNLDHNIPTYSDSTIASKSNAVLCEYPVEKRMDVVDNWHNIIKEVSTSLSEAELSKWRRLTNQ